MAGPSATPQLTAIALQPADLPAGWTGAPDTPDPDEAVEDASLAQCVGGRDNDADETAESDSDDYSLDNATISSSASSFKSPADVADDVAIIKSPKIDACYSKLAATELSKSLPPGSTLNSASITVTPGSAGGPSNVVGTGAGKVDVTVSGQVVDLYLNVAFITGPSIEAEVDFVNLGTPVPTALQATLIAKVASRAGAAAQA